MKFWLINLIKAYCYFISPWIGRQCRFFPSCSEYAKDAIIKYGVWRGAYFSLKRLSRCHPWHPGGYDPLP